MGPRAGQDRCGKPRFHRDSIPGPSSPQSVTIPSKLPGLHTHTHTHTHRNIYIYYTYLFIYINVDGLFKI